jgi:Fe-S cluster assembly protein SufD
MPPVPAFAPEGAVDRVAAEAFAAAAMPSVDEEVWRYSRIGELDLGRFAPAPIEAPAGALHPAASSILDLAAGAGSYGLVTVSGRLTHTVELGGPSAGIAIGGGPATGAPAHAAPDALVTLNDAFATPIRITVQPGAVAGPVVIVHWVGDDGVASFPQVVLDAGADSEVAVLEVFVSAPTTDALVVPVTRLNVGKAARVGHVAIQDLGRATWQLGLLDAAVEADATLTATAAALGAGYGRLRTDCRLVGRGATGNLRALWFGEDDQTLDFRTFQEHAAPDTTSNLVYKGAVAGRSRSVYTGLIRVDEVARGTNAQQTNRNLKLSDDAWAESVPNLEIKNNDVRCAHASAVGPVDEEQRWYLESRGVPTGIAERLIVAGFFEEVVADLPIAGAIAPLRAAIAGKLDRSGVDR